MTQKHGIVCEFILFYVCMIQHNKALFKHLYSLDVENMWIYISKAVLGTKAHLSSETQICNKPIPDDKRANQTKTWQPKSDPTARGRAPGAASIRDSWKSPSKKVKSWRIMRRCSR